MIDYKSRDPIYIQLKNRITQDIVLGLLKKDQQLLPVRQLAAEIGVNPNTVQKTYRELEREGIIYSLPGRGSFVAAPKKTAEGVEKQFQEALNDLVNRFYTAGLPADRLVQLIQVCLRAHPLLNPASGAGGAAEGHDSDQKDQTEQLQPTGEKEPSAFSSADPVIPAEGDRL